MDLRSNIHYKRSKVTSISGTQRGNKCVAMVLARKPGTKRHRAAPPARHGCLVNSLREDNARHVHTSFLSFSYLVSRATPSPAREPTRSRFGRKLSLLSTGSLRWFRVYTFTIGCSATNPQRVNVSNCNELL